MPSYCSYVKTGMRSLSMLTAGLAPCSTYVEGKSLFYVIMSITYGIYTAEALYAQGRDWNPERQELMPPPPPPPPPDEVLRRLLAIEPALEFTVHTYVTYYVYCRESATVIGNW